MSKLRLFYKPTCPYCMKVMRVIEKYDIDVEYVDISADPKAKEELVNIGGSEMVPCLFIDNEPMYESSDIIHYLKTNYAKEEE